MKSDDRHDDNKEDIKMKMDELIHLVDNICVEKGYSDSPAYDLIFAEVKGRNEIDAIGLIASMLADYNRILL